MAESENDSLGSIHEDISLFPHFAHRSQDMQGAPAQTPACSPQTPSGAPLLSALNGPTSWTHWGFGDPGSRGNPGRGGSPRRQGLGAAIPGDEEDDAQRVGGDGKDVESERGPEGDEGATEEHGRRHGARGSQSRGPNGTRGAYCAVLAGCGAGQAGQAPGAPTEPGPGEALEAGPQGARRLVSVEGGAEQGGGASVVFLASQSWGWRCAPQPVREEGGA